MKSTTYLLVVMTVLCLCFILRALLFIAKHALFVNLLVVRFVRFVWFVRFVRFVRFVWFVRFVRFGGSTRKYHPKTQAARGFDHHHANIRSD